MTDLAWVFAALAAMAWILVGLHWWQVRRWRQIAAAWQELYNRQVVLTQAALGINDEALAMNAALIAELPQPASPQVH